MFRISYPERRVVSNELMLTWYQDAVTNGEIEDSGPQSAYWAAYILHEAGLITLVGGSASNGHPILDYGHANR